MGYIMKYKLCKMIFSTPVHFGEGRLGKTTNTFMADRLFSALYIEAIKCGAETAEKLYTLTKEGKLLFSDGMPYIGEHYYIPKPVIRVANDGESSSILKKAFKKLSYIPLDRIDDYVCGKLDPQEENHRLKELGKYSIAEKAAVRTGGEDALPFAVGIFSFCNDSSLYFILGYDNDETLDFVQKLIVMLGYTGIGGKVSSGSGKFSVEICDISKDTEQRLMGEYERYITLSVSMAKDSELKKAVEGAGYMMIKRSGFVSSHTYAETNRKKKELYCFTSGSCFTNRFEGDIFDLAIGGSHSVYRYAKPIFMGVDLP